MLAGADDGRMTNAARERLAASLRRHGATVELDVITVERVDGRIFSTTSHKLTEDFSEVWRQYGANLLRFPALHDSDLGSDRTYLLPTATGRWVIRFQPRPMLEFLSEKP